MSTATDLAEIARAIAEQAEKLDRARGALREHPEQVADVVDPLVGMLLSIDRVIDAAGTAFQEHGATAVTTFGERGIHLGADRWIGAGWWSGSSAPGPGRGCLVEATGPRARSSSPLRTSLLRLGVADEIAVGHWGRVHGTFQEA